MHCITGLQLIVAFLLAWAHCNFELSICSCLFPLYNFLRGCASGSGIPVPGGDKRKVDRKRQPPTIIVDERIEQRFTRSIPLASGRSTTVLVFSNYSMARTEKLA